MKTDELQTVDDVRNTILNVCRETQVPTNISEIKYEENGRFSIDDKTKFYLTDVTQKEFCSLIGVSKNSFVRSSESLKRAMVEELLMDKVDINLVLSENDDSTLVCKHFIKSEHPYITTLLAFDVATEVLKPFNPKAVFNVERGFEAIDFVTTEERKVEKVGDVLRAGITFDSRISGMRQELQMGAFSYTLSCSNGLIGRRENLSTIEVQDPKDFVNIIRASVERMYNLSKDDLVKHLRDLSEKTVKDPTQLVHRATKEFAVGTKHRSSILDKIPSIGEDPSYYKVINLVTEYAKNVPSLKARRRLQEFGGYMTLNSECRCELCKSKL